MREISDLINTNAANATNPVGTVRDESSPGLSDGTPINEKMVGDLLVLQSKLALDAGITPNGLPDNNTNLFQLKDALLTAVTRRSLVFHELKATYAAQAWSGIAWGNGIVVKCSTDGTDRVVWSDDDGATWNVPTTAPTSEVWNDVWYDQGNDIFILVGESSAVATSADFGDNWTDRAFATGGNFNAVTSNDSVIVAVADNSGGPTTPFCETSTDGITWTARTMDGLDNRNCIVWSDEFSKFFSGGGDSIEYSTDGISWTNITSVGSNDVIGISFGNGKVLAAISGGTNYAVSTNGTSFTDVAKPTNNGWRACTFNNGEFRVIGTAAAATNVVYRSADLLNWESLVVLEDNSWIDIKSGDGKFYSVSSDGTNRVMVGY